MLWFKRQYSARMRDARMPCIAVIDIDGVIADVRHRLHYVTSRPRDWDGFFAAAPMDGVLFEGLARVVDAIADGLAIVYLTGRPEQCRAATAAWLVQHHFPDGPLLMRDDGDRRPARLLKVEALRRLARESEVGFYLDDDAAVVEAARAAGFRAVQATWMTQATEVPEQRALSLAQEDLGRS